MGSSKASPKFATVIVPYNPDEGFSERLAAHAREAGPVIVADNSTERDKIELVRRAASVVPDCEVLPQKGNPGLGVAQNAGIRRALELGAEWVMLLDDDSSMVPGMARTMFDALDRYPDPHRVGLLAPRVVDEHSRLESKVIVSRGRFDVRRIMFDDAPWIDTALTAIASGSLIRAEALRECGLMREDFFIDGIDIEYCLRLRRNGWRLLMVRDACLHHRLGAKTTHALAGATFVASNHSALRRYTIMRNRVNIWRNYARDVPGYVAYDMAVSVFETLKIVAFEPHRAEKVRAMLAGLKDGFRKVFPHPATALCRPQSGDDS